MAVMHTTAVQEMCAAVSYISENKIFNFFRKTHVITMLFHLHLQRKPDHILPSNVHLTIYKTSDFHQTWTEHSLKWLCNVRKICVDLTTGNSLVALICEAGPGLERLWEPPAALRAFRSLCLRKQLGIKHLACSGSIPSPANGSCLLTGTRDIITALTEKKYE